MNNFLLIILIVLLVFIITFLLINSNSNNIIKNNLNNNNNNNNINNNRDLYKNKSEDDNNIIDVQGYTNELMYSSENLKSGDYVDQFKSIDINTKIIPKPACSYSDIPIGNINVNFLLDKCN